jgi:hypothetical protein
LRGKAVKKIEIGETKVKSEIERWTDRQMRRRLLQKER